MELALDRQNGQGRGGLVSDHRTGKRFPLELPIKISKEQEGSALNAMTGNLSAAGVYIKADSSLEIGSAVEFEIALPPEMTGAKDNVIIQCRGRVVRADEASGDKDSRGVACEIDSYDFVRHS